MLSVFKVTLEKTNEPNDKIINCTSIKIIDNGNYIIIQELGDDQKVFIETSEIKVKSIEIAEV